MDFPELFRDLLERLKQVGRIDFLNLVLHDPDRHVMRLNVLQALIPVTIPYFPKLAEPLSRMGSTPKIPTNRITSGHFALSMMTNLPSVIEAPHIQIRKGST